MCVRLLSKDRKQLCPSSLTSKLHFKLFPFSILKQVGPHTSSLQSFSLMLAWLMGASCSAKHILEQSHNRLTMLHITYEQWRFVMIQIFLICSLLFCCYHPVSEMNAESETLITAHHSMMQQKTPTFLCFFPAFPLSYPNLTLPPLSQTPTPLRATSCWQNQKLTFIRLSVRFVCGSHRIYIYCIYSILILSLSDLTGCALQWKVSRVLRSTQGVIPTAVLQSELSLAQQTGGTEAKRLFLPREQGSTGEKRWTGANGTSLPPFKLQEKMDFYNSLL